MSDVAEIIKRHKALSVSPLKASQTLGAALAFLGFRGAIPMLHGSQGCTAFGKVFFVRHFREPIPLQTTAMDQVTTIMGSEDSVIEGLRTLCEKHAPLLIGLPTTALSETQGSDVNMAVREFRKLHPAFAAVPVVPVSAPDFSGCLETGFAKALEAIISTLVPSAHSAGTVPGRRQRQVNVLVGSSLTPGDLEELKDIIEQFGLRPVLLPDLSDSLDGHLGADQFSPLTIGGAEVSELQTLGDARATLVIGASLHMAADLLHELTGVPDFRLDHLMGLEAVDGLMLALHEISAEAVPERIERQRAQLHDAMLDCHFMLGMSRFALAGDPDLIHAFSEFLHGVGAEVVVAVSSVNAPVFARSGLAEIKIGDLEDLERSARERGVDVLVTNSHGVEPARRLGRPLVRAGFPQYDLLGGYQKTWIGYRGSRQTLFDLANLLLELGKGEIHPYRSIYAQKPEYQEAVNHGSAEAFAAGVPRQ